MGVMTVIVKICLTEILGVSTTGRHRQVKWVNIMLVPVPIGDDLEPPGRETNKENNQSQFH